MAKNGTYEAPGQVPIVVVDGGELPDGLHGPWVRWRFPWESDEKCAATLWTDFGAMIAHAGYVHVESVPNGGHDAP